MSGWVNSPGVLGLRALPARDPLLCLAAHLIGHEGGVVLVSVLVFLAVVAAVRGTVSDSVS